MDAETLRRAVLEPWCMRCGGPWHSGHDEPDTEHRPPLWTRDPSLRPEGLVWETIGKGPHAARSPNRWVLRGCVLANHDDATALVGWSLAVALAKAYRDGPVETVWHHSPGEIVLALASDNPVRELAALAHKMLDAKEGGDGLK